MASAMRTRGPWRRAAVPDMVIATGRSLVSPSGLYAAAAFRVGVGLVLILAARESRAPGMLRAIGAVVIISGVALQYRARWRVQHGASFRSDPW